MVRPPAPPPKMDVALGSEIADIDKFNQKTWNFSNVVAGTWLLMEPGIGFREFKRVAPGIRAHSGAYAGVNFYFGWLLLGLGLGTALVCCASGLDICLSECVMLAGWTQALWENFEGSYLSSIIAGLFCLSFFFRFVAQVMEFRLWFQDFQLGRDVKTPYMFGKFS